MAECKTEGLFKNSQDCTTKQKITRPQDFIAVAGSAEGGWSDNISSAFRQSVGNRYMFINQAIRALYTFDKPEYAKDGTPKKQRILVVFQFRYTKNDIKKIEKYAQNASSRVVYVKSEKEFIEFLNKRKALNREIKKLEIYSHGVIGFISFHYSSDIFKHKRVPDGVFGKSSVDKVNASIFARDAQVTSYACRTSIGEEGDKFPSSSAAKPENSLAQYMADKWGILIRAYERRSLYTNTYGTAKEIAEASNYKGTDPILVQRSESIEQREENEKNDGGPIMLKGA